MTADEKLALIKSLCRHPGLFDWSGQEIAAKVLSVIDSEDTPILYRLSDEDQPIPYELVADAVHVEDE